MTAYTPRAYQPPTTQYILDHPRCAVWGFLGCGKTSATLDALATLDMCEPGPTLVLAPPKVARSTWSDEAQKWEDFHRFKISPLVGTPAERQTALWKKADIYTVSHENLPWLMDKLKNDWPFRKVVWDEATKLRGWRGSEQTSKLGKKFIRSAGSARLKEFGKITHSRIDRFIELTAKPAPNGLKNLWPQLWFLDKGARLGNSYDAFMQRWFKLGYNGYDVVPLPSADKEINEKIKDICISLDEKDYFDLKEPIVTPVYVDLPTKARSIYKEMEKQFFVKIKNKEIEAFNSASRSGKLLQIASGVLHHNQEFSDDGEKKDKEWSAVHDEKIEALKSIIEQANGTPLIVAYAFVPDLIRLKKAFPNGVHLQTKKQEDDFKAGKIDLLFLHPSSAGHGLDGFQRATNMLAFFGRDWNLDTYDQLVGRINPVRQFQAGFDRPVFIWHIMARGTMDEDVDVRHKTKGSVQDILLNAVKLRG